MWTYVQAYQTKTIHFWAKCCIPYTYRNQLMPRCHKRITWPIYRQYIQQHIWKDFEVHRLASSGLSIVVSDDYQSNWTKCEHASSPWREVQLGVHKVSISGRKSCGQSRYHWWKLKRTSQCVWRVLYPGLFVTWLRSQILWYDHASQCPDMSGSWILFTRNPWICYSKRNITRWYTLLDL